MPIVRTFEIRGRLVDRCHDRGDWSEDVAELDGESLDVVLFDAAGAGCLVDHGADGSVTADYGYVRLTIEQYGPAPEPHGPPRVLACPRCGSLTPTAPDYRCFDCGRTWEVTP